MPEEPSDPIEASREALELADDADRRTVRDRKARGGFGPDERR
jgi:hypothetical protein